MGYNIKEIKRAIKYTVEDMIFIEIFLLRSLRIDSMLLRNIRTLLDKLVLLFEKYDNVNDIVDNMEIDDNNVKIIESVIEFYGAQKDYSTPRTRLIYNNLFYVKNILNMR